MQLATVRGKEIQKKSVTRDNGRLAPRMVVIWQQQQ
jgi:hypothetical protein